jgi:hypothetical protein
MISYDDIEAFRVDFSVEESAARQDLRTPELEIREKLNELLQKFTKAHPGVDPHVSMKFDSDTNVMTMVVYPRPASLEQRDLI